MMDNLKIIMLKDLEDIYLKEEQLSNNYYDALYLFVKF